MSAKFDGEGSDMHEATANDGSLSVEPEVDRRLDTAGYPSAEDSDVLWMCSTPSRRASAARSSVGQSGQRFTPNSFADAERSINGGSDEARSLTRAVRVSSTRQRPSPGGDGAQRRTAPAPAAAPARPGRVATSYRQWRSGRGDTRRGSPGNSRRSGRSPLQCHLRGRVRRRRRTARRTVQGCSMWPRRDFTKGRATSPVTSPGQTGSLNDNDWAGPERPGMPEHPDHATGEGTAAGAGQLNEEMTAPDGRRL
jgi:hypothetical protein